MKLGLTQADVGLSLGSLYGNSLSESTISKFENLRLSVNNFQDLRRILQKWLDKMETDQNVKLDKTQSNQIIKRKKVHFNIPENQAEEEVIKSLQEESCLLNKKSKPNKDLDLISPAKEELSESDKTFAKQFKQRRMKLGLSQAEVGLSLGSLYGIFYVRSVICKFENLQLSVNNFHKLKPILQKWLQKTESDQAMKREKTQSNVNMKRKKIPSINPEGKIWKRSKIC